MLYNDISIIKDNMQVDVTHSFLYNIALKFLKNRTNFGLGDNLLPVFKHGFLKSEENVNLNNFQHKMAYECWCFL